VHTLSTRILRDTLLGGRLPLVAASRHWPPTFERLSCALSLHKRLALLPADPTGRYGRIQTTNMDDRFCVDPDNPTIRAATGFPMCIPRSDPAVADDVLCPVGSGCLLITEPSRQALPRLAQWRDECAQKEVCSVNVLQRGLCAHLPSCRDI
jgi:hypothetical protein